MISEKAKRAIEVIDEIASLSSIVSSLDYEISVASEEEQDNLQEQFKRFQNQSNELVNRLKDEGIALDYDGPITYVSRNGKPWLEQNRTGDWIEHFDSKEKVKYFWSDLDGHEKAMAKSRFTWTG